MTNSLTISKIAARTRATKRRRMIDEAVRRAKLVPWVTREIVSAADRFGVGAAESSWPKTIARIRAEFQALRKGKR